eukprot:jgi/Mesen1/9100/ME000058S08596
MIVDRALVLLFQRSPRPQNVLCAGFRQVPTSAAAHTTSPALARTLREESILPMKEAHTSQAFQTPQPRPPSPPLPLLPPSIPCNQSWVRRAGALLSTRREGYQPPTCVLCSESPMSKQPAEGMCACVLTHAAEQARPTV